MKCPFCGFSDTRVIDSRLGKEGNNIRRRRECSQCGRRFTTFERVEDMLPLIIKKDARRQPFDRKRSSPESSVPAKNALFPSLP